MSRLDERLLRAYHERWQDSLSSRNEEQPEPDPKDVATVAELWEKELDRAGVEKAVFFTSTESHDEILRFVALRPERFIAYTTLNPARDGSADILERQISENGIKGLKLYPMARHFRVNDPACCPVFRVCQEHSLPVVVHFGLSINAAHDLSYGQALDLSAPALRFPAVKWIIPHFGAGFFREAFLVAAQYSNVYIDTSSSNNWIRYSPTPLTVADLFKRTREALGSRRIIFGTDSSFFPRGFRGKILEQQLSICNDLGFSESEIDDIFYGNIREILNL
jgi:predicted TIM-barrel fold metal-dependent hydrolase